jgi:2-C-methyl-D-erythritol 4-phosphate cytidylyltransferase
MKFFDGIDEDGSELIIRYFLYNVQLPDSFGCNLLMKCFLQILKTTWSAMKNIMKVEEMARTASIYCKNLSISQLNPVIQKHQILLNLHTRG